MGLAALNERRDFKGGGGYSSKEKKVNVKKVSFFYNSLHMFGTIPPPAPLKSLRSFKAARPIEAMIGVSKAS